MTLGVGRLLTTRLWRPQPGPVGQTVHACSTGIPDREWLPQAPLQVALPWEGLEFFPGSPVRSSSRGPGAVVQTRVSLVTTTFGALGSRRQV